MTYIAFTSCIKARSLSVDFTRSNNWADLANLCYTRSPRVCIENVGDDPNFLHSWPLFLLLASSHQFIWPISLLGPICTDVCIGQYFCYEYY